MVNDQDVKYQHNLDGGCYVSVTSYFLGVDFRKWFNSRVVRISNHRETA